MAIQNAIMTVRQTISNRWATFIGALALLMWSLSATFVTSINNIPTFEVIAIAFSISFLITAIILTVKHQWYKILGQPLILWIVGLLGVYGNDVTFIAAFKYAPALHADLINYLWPIFVILFSSLLPSEKFSGYHFVACLFGFAGVYCIITNKSGLGGFNKNYILGYAFAFADAMIWAAYTVVARHYKKTPIEMIGMYCGIGAVCSIFTHFYYESTVIPTVNQLGVIILMGLTTQGLAYFFWDIGVKRGNFRLLSVLSYTCPVLSVIFLIASGYAHLDSAIVLGCFFISLATIFAGHVDRKEKYSREAMPGVTT